MAEIDALKNREKDWFAGLFGDEKIVAEVAIEVFKRVVFARHMTGGCYNLAFFIREYLKREKDIDVEMVVGWITEDSWAGCSSHAWIEHNSKKTDVSLSITEQPNIQLTGSVIIQDFDYRRGATTYVYQRESPANARIYLDLAASKSAEFNRNYRRKEIEHLSMKALAEREGGASEYFNMAPVDMKYETMKKIMASKLEIPVL
ncbi:MAG: hypothetical protein ACKVOT_11010 [Polaromonas sp.]